MSRYDRNLVAETKGKVINQTQGKRQKRRLEMLDQKTKEKLRGSPADARKFVRELSAKLPPALALSKARFEQEGGISLEFAHPLTERARRKVNEVISEVAATFVPRGGGEPVRFSIEDPDVWVLSSDNTVPEDDETGADYDQRRRNMNPKKFSITRTPEDEEAIRATMAMPVDQRIARMEAFIRECDETIAVLGPESTVRLSQIEGVAEEIAAEQNVDHGQAVRLAISESGAAPSGVTVTPDSYGDGYPGRDEDDEITEMAVPTDAEVQDYARDRKTDYGTALHEMLTDRQEKAVAHSQPDGLGRVYDYSEDEMKAALKERGYDAE